MIQIFLYLTVLIDSKLLYVDCNYLFLITIFIFFCLIVIFLCPTSVFIPGYFTKFSPDLSSDSFNSAILQFIYLVFLYYAFVEQFVH